MPTDQATYQLWLQGGFFTLLVLILTVGIPFLIKAFSKAHDDCTKHIEKIMDDRANTSEAIDKLCEANTAGIYALKEHITNESKANRHDHRDAISAMQGTLMRNYERNYPESKRA